MNYLRLPDGTTWPNPMDPANIQWELRYGDPERVRFVAASYVAAYAEMVGATTRRRTAVVRDLRRAVLGVIADGAS